MSINLPVPTCFDTLLEAKLDADASRDLIMQTAKNHWPGSRRRLSAKRVARPSE
jgi:hypothetical protein